MRWFISRSHVVHGDQGAAAKGFAFAGPKWSRASLPQPPLAGSNGEVDSYTTSKAAIVQTRSTAAAEQPAEQPHEGTLPHLQNNDQCGMSLISSLRPSLHAAAKIRYTLARPIPRRQAGLRQRPFFGPDAVSLRSPPLPITVPFAESV